MKKVFFISLIFAILASWSLAITIDGSTTGDSYVAIGTGSGAGWAGVSLEKLYLTSDADSAYFCVTGTGVASWEVGVLYIYSPGITTFADPTATDAWARQINILWSNRPNVQFHYNLDNSWMELRTWNGTGWNTFANASCTYAVNGNFDFEVAIPLSVLGITGTQGINVEAAITGNNATHGCFDAVPDDEVATMWDQVPPNNLVNKISVNVPVELSDFKAE